MRPVDAALAALALPLMFPLILFAQASQSSLPLAVPRVINVTGVLQPADGQPAAAEEMVTVSISADSAADRLQVFGDIRVGTAGSNGCINDFSGSAIAGVCSSDARLKKDVTPFGPALGAMIALRPVHYSWRADEFPDRRFGHGRASGLIAQEVEQVLPELVVTGDDGFKAVDYRQLPLLTIQALKELKAENDALTARVAALERLIKELAAGKATTAP